MTRENTTLIRATWNTIFSLTEVFDGPGTFVRFAASYLDCLCGGLIRLRVLLGAAPSLLSSDFLVRHPPPGSSESSESLSGKTDTDRRGTIQNSSLLVVIVRELTFFRTPYILHLLSPFVRRSLRLSISSARTRCVLDRELSYGHCLKQFSSQWSIRMKR